MWGFGKSKEIERIHLKFCKRLLNVKSSTSSNAICSELGRYPLFINRFVKIIQYWCNIVSSANNVLTKMYHCLLETSINRNNWIYNVKTLLDRHVFSRVWINPNSIGLKTFHLIFKQRLQDTFKQQWYNKLVASESVCTYRSYKTTMEFEEYIDLLPKKLRFALASLRLSSLKLRIETGRYPQNRIDRVQRKCLSCNVNDLEDEYHFVYICPTYNDLSTTYIKKILLSTSTCIHVC